MRKQKGITLVALIITIIVLLVLAIVSIRLVINGGIIGKAESGTDAYLESEIKEKVNLAYHEWKMDMESGGSLDLKEVVENELNESYGAESVNVSKQGRGILVKVTKSGKEYEYTLIDDGTTVNGQLAYLDIADGNIDLYENGYKQYTGNLQNLDKNGATECNGKYIITGTTTENVVRVCDVGTYDITIKDLNINIKGKTPIICNARSIANGHVVNITIEGDNYLATTNGPAISFDIAYNTEESITDRSTIVFKGDGSLTAELIGNNLGAVIGGSYGGGGGNNNCNANLIVNSGTYNLGLSYNGASLGSGLRGSGFFITINGGKIYANGGAYGGAIGGRDGDGCITINGGYIETTGNSVIGYKWRNVEINGGTIYTGRTSCKAGGNIKFTGGNILLKGKNPNIATYEEGTSNLIAYTPNDGTNNLYETKIKLQGVEKDKQITKLTTSDNINYGIKDMYTLDEGMLYLYLPLGTRTINVEVDGKTYTGTVETKETSEVVTLNKVN